MTALRPFQPGHVSRLLRLSTASIPTPDMRQRATEPAFVGGARVTSRAPFRG
jgi:hypothetical protein